MRTRRSRLLDCPSVRPTTRADELRARVDDVAFWWHSIDLGDGIVTPGTKSSTRLEEELARLELGDLSGKSVLGIGAYDGYYSFAAERLGAERVVAFDQYVWSADMPGYMEYRDQRVAAGLTVEPVEAVPEFWRPNELPGRRPFDLAHEALDSRVEVVVGDLLDYDLGSLGTFDIVLCLGVLYHIRHPMLALERLASVTRGTAIIETQAEAFRSSDNLPLCRFIEGDELNHDPGNLDVHRGGTCVDVSRRGLRARRDAPSAWIVAATRQRHAARVRAIPRGAACEQGRGRAYRRRLNRVGNGYSVRRSDRSSDTGIDLVPWTPRRLRSVAPSILRNDPKARRKIPAIPPSRAPRYCVYP